MTEIIPPAAKSEPMNIRKQFFLILVIVVQISSAFGFGWGVYTHFISSQDPLSISMRVITSLVGLIYLACSIWILSLERSSEASLSFAIFTASISALFSGYFDIQVQQQFLPIWTFCLGLAAGAILHFALIFPRETRLIKRFPMLKWAGYSVGILIAGSTIPFLFDMDSLIVLKRVLSFGFIFLGLAIFIFLVKLIFQRFRSKSLDARKQANVLLWGIIVGIFPITSGQILNILGLNITQIQHYLILPVSLFPIFVIYGLLHYHWARVKPMINRAILHMVLSALVVGGYGLVVSGLSLILGDITLVQNPYVVGIMFFILALVFNPIRAWMQKSIDQVFSWSEKTNQVRIEQFNDEITPTLTLEGIEAILGRYVEDIFSPSLRHLFIFDSQKDQYVAIGSPSGRATTNIRFEVDSPLFGLFSGNRNPLYLTREDKLPDVLAPEKSRIDLLDVKLFIPLPGMTGQVVGILALGERLSGQAYTTTDLVVLSSLCDQSGLVVERIQIVANLERRIDEMNVLNRISRGINITLEFDDILELIYAQTNRIIPSKDFWVMLADQKRGEYHYVFYLENDQRVSENENQLVVGKVDLAQDVIRTAGPIVTKDYGNEAQQRGYPQLIDGLFAWVGVPLNTGAECIGAISLGSRDPLMVYSDDQERFLQAIADQAAGAIVKANLMGDSERQAQQLSMLNEIARNLTSILEYPRLLDTIIENAVEIADSESGALILLNEDAGEYVYEVVVGPGVKGLLGKSLSPGVGPEGQLIESGEAVLSNDDKIPSGWERRKDHKNGYQRQNLLIIPMYVQEKMIGAIKVINRRDGMPFSNEDQEFLTAFGIQAAIALENARLYTLTDLQLAERVDEFSIMQRIDRDLNTSLDVTRAMQITLNWAMKRSNAEAGLVGILTDDGLQVMADEGSDDRLDLYPGKILRIELPEIKLSELDKPLQLFHEEEQKRHISLLEDGKKLFFIPIRRENMVIGILLLESIQDNPWGEEIQDFLSRLTDHAAIAIANAQLFLQLQEADLAKSDFISFVSHELKTPMTSIRGYTDLMLSEAVGKINDAQKNFLHTIRSNVIRMSTLVSDLADVSRIESGRLRIEFSSVEVDDIVDEVVTSQATGLNEKGQRLNIQIPEQLNPVWGDRLRLIQVMTNLVNNAHKYSPSGSEIKITASQQDNYWDPKGAPNVVVVSVRDTGIGMTAEDQNQIFTKFFRSSDPKAREAQGTGLGLNISKNLIEMQGGRIWFESKLGQGTTFFFTIPAVEG